MKLDHIDLNLLSVSPLNVRKHGHKDIVSLAHSIRTLGLLQPLLVRKADEGFAVIAGQRRLKACQLIVQEGGEPFLIPCMVMEDGEDASAIEASLAENIERLPMDEIDQYEAFAAMLEKGRDVEQIAAQFGITGRLVRQRLAIANLDDRILNLYRREEITADTMRSLTMASKARQKAWLKLYRDPEARAPIGRNLRAWVLGGSQVKVGVAIFPIEQYKGAIVSDLFGEDSYFADAQSFWALQHQAIRERSAAYIERGWTDVALLEEGNYFPAYEYVKTPKSRGGKVFMLLTADGEVQFHEGYLTRKDAEAKERQKEGRQQDGDEPAGRAALPKPELTKAAQNYVDLHRHAAVQAGLIDAPSLTLRLVTAHLVAGSPLWSIRADVLRADKPESRISRDASPSAVLFAQQRIRALDLLGDFDSDEDDEFGESGEDIAEDDDVEVEDDGDRDGDANDGEGAGANRSGTMLVRQGWSGPYTLEGVFARLCDLTDSDVMAIMSVAMAETLAVDSPVIDKLGTCLGLDMAKLWTCDDAFLDLVTSKETLLSMVQDLGGTITSNAHKASAGKVMRGVIRQYVTGEGRSKVEGWVPPYLTFLASTYKEAGAAEDSAAQAEAA